MPDNPKSTARIAGHPLHPMLVPIPIACFVGTLLGDLAYWRTEDVMWSNLSIWLLAIGLLAAALAILAGLVDYVFNPRIRALGAARAHVVGNVFVIVLSIVNAFVHSRDGYTAVVPDGLILSALVVVILGFTAWMGGALVYRHGVGVRR